MISYPSQTSQIWRIVRKILKVAAVFSGLLVCAVLALCLYVSRDLPSVDALRTEEGLRSLPHLDNWPEQQVMLLPLHEIPPHVVNAFILANAPRDCGGANFSAHMSRYLLSAHKAKYGHFEGAVMELTVALFLDKEEILSAWLATAYFGKNTYGLSAAAKKYCAKPISELTVCEAALLASIPKAPSTCNPIDHPDRAREEQKAVLSKMINLGLAREKDLIECNYNLLN